ncbi:MAG: hypothetical protein PHD06_12450 [Bacteroidales bacterium]|nr:hypothetical protein [Bacteroidales bacterium]MDD4385976.1 hypothetical protein [Bacteroidales bacterium]
MLLNFYLKFCISTVFVLTFSIQSTSQEAYVSWNGRIVSEENLSIEFVHIQINANNRHFLFMSDDNGVVNILYNNSSPSDTAIISCVGYETKKIAVSSLASINSIILSKRYYEIGEVVVTPRKCKTVTIGNKKKKPIGHSQMYFNTQSALNILNPGICGKIKSVSIYMYNRYEKAWKYRPFRLRLYEGGDSIGNELIKNEIIANLPSDKKNWVTINIAPFNISLPSSGIVVSVEALSAEYYFRNGYIESVISKNGLVNSISVGWTFDGIRGSKGIESWRYSEYNGWHQRNSKNNFLYKINIEVCEE